MSAGAPRRFTGDAQGGGRFRVTDGTASWSIVVDRAGGSRWITIEGMGTVRVERAVPGRRRGREAAAGELAAPMPGRVVKVLVAVGDAVGKGQDLVVVEAMKMEIKVAAPHDGHVKAVHVAAGDPCAAGPALVEIES